MKTFSGVSLCTVFCFRHFRWIILVKDGVIQRQDIAYLQLISCLSYKLWPTWFPFTINSVWPCTQIIFTHTQRDREWCLTRQQQHNTQMDIPKLTKRLDQICVCVCVCLPAVGWAAGPLGRWGPPARGRCSGSRRRRTAARTREGVGSAGRHGPSPAGSYSAGHMNEGQDNIKVRVK